MNKTANNTAAERKIEFKIEFMYEREPTEEEKNFKHSPEAIAQSKKAERALAQLNRALNLFK